MSRRTIKQHDQAVSSIVRFLMAMADSPTGKGIRAQGARYNGPWDWLIQHGSVMRAGKRTPPIRWPGSGGIIPRSRSG